MADSSAEQAGMVSKPGAVEVDGEAPPKQDPNQSKLEQPVAVGHSPAGAATSTGQSCESTKTSKASTPGGQGKQKTASEGWWTWTEATDSGVVRYAGLAMAQTKKKWRFDGHCKLVDNGVAEVDAEVGSWTWGDKEIDRNQLDPLQPGVVASALKVRQAAEEEVQRLESGMQPLSQDVAAIYISWVLQKWNTRKSVLDHGSLQHRTTKLVQDVCNQVERVLESIAHQQGVDILGCSGAGQILGTLHKAGRIAEDLFNKVQRYVRKTRNPTMHDGEDVYFGISRAEHGLQVLGALLRSFSGAAQAAELDCLFESHKESSMPGPVADLNFLQPFLTNDFRHKERNDKPGIVVQRGWLIDQLLQKLNQEGRPSVLLTAPAGFGKSVVMEELCWGAGGWSHAGGRQNITVVAQHFCRYDVPRSLNPAAFVCNLASMLATSLPEYCRKLQSSSNLQAMFSEAALRRGGGCSDAIEFAVHKPLVELYGKDGPGFLKGGKVALIVVDALDEAALLDSDHTILGLLHKLDKLLLSGKLPWLKMVCSSRLDVVGAKQQLDEACRLVCCKWKDVSLNSEDEQHQDSICKDLRTFLDRRLEGSQHLRRCLEACVDSRVGSHGRREKLREQLLGEFLQRAEISFRWLVFALDCMDKPDNGGTDFADTKGLPKGLSELYRERFKEQVSLKTFQQLQPILEAVVAPLPYAQPLSTAALYDTVRFSGWRGFMQDLETSLELELGGYMSQCAGVWHLDHRSVAEWLLDRKQAGKYACSGLRGMASRAAQILWAGGVLEREEDMQRTCSYLGLTVPPGPPRADHMDIDSQRLHDVLSAVHAWAGENGKGADYAWLAASLLSNYVTKQEDAHLKLEVPGGASWEAESTGLAVVHAVAAWLEPVQSLDGAWSLNANICSLALRGYKVDPEAGRALVEALAQRQGSDGTWQCNQALQTLDLRRASPCQPLPPAACLLLLIGEEHADCSFIGDEGAKALAGALAPRQGSDGTWHCNQALQILNLDDNGIGDEGAKALAEALAPQQGSNGTWHCNQALQTLYLDGASTCQPFPPSPAACLLVLIGEGQADDESDCGATTLLDGAADNGVGDEGAKALAEALAPQQGRDGTWHCNLALQTLTLFNSGIGDEGAKALAEALAPRQGSSGTWHVNQALQNLDLRVNGIGDEGVKALAKALAPRQGSDGTCHCNQALQTLYLDGSFIGDEGAKALAEALAPRQGSDGTWRCNQALQTLDLFGTNIGDEGAKALAEALTPRQGSDGTWHYNQALQTLYLDGEALGAEGCTVLQDWEQSLNTRRPHGIQGAGALHAAAGGADRAVAEHLQRAMTERPAFQKALVEGNAALVAEQES
eukprot:jgi/Tetstr1/465060/TSEL_009788.t1